MYEYEVRRVNDCHGALLGYEFLNRGRWEFLEAGDPVVVFVSPLMPRIILTEQYGDGVPLPGYEDDPLGRMEWET